MLGYYSQRRYILLNLISHLGPISRKKLIELTGFRPATVTELVKNLIDEGLVLERGFIAGGPGRRRSLLELNSEKLCAIGVLLSYTRMTCILSQIDGAIVEHIDEEVLDLKEDELAETVISRILAVIRSHPERRIVGIGLADPLYDEAKFGFASSLPQIYDRFVDWGHMELAPRIRSRVDIPVHSFSAQSIAALAEHHYGSARGLRDFICVELSNGIGMSIMSGGSVVAGFQGRAGELGHTTINFGTENRSMCYCGKAGCVEADAAFPYIRKNICEALKNGTYSALLDFYDPSRPLTVADVRRGLDMGDILCEHYVREAARRAGAAIANAVNILNPEMIVLYGTMTGLGDFYIDEIRSICRRNTLVLLRDYQVAVNTSMEDLLPLGAAAEMFNEYLKAEDQGWIYRLPKETETEAETEDEEEET